ncbi:growth factor receptor-bound protein 7 [Egretta garzetta]|uniref:growth factor receptor-bound protein 7 n=1 Tax=Egretta garzetta TaxID=188379 RepID=UPI00051F001C|nr:growth factor receptor-bound protein 7 [Egretta garzetta]
MAMGWRVGDRAVPPSRGPVASPSVTSPIGPSERCLEDHESVVEVQSSWPPGANSCFVFRKNFAKYELFKSNAQSLFPEVMVSSCLEANKSMAHSELIQNFLNSGSCPEVQGFLQLREAGRKVWKRFYFSLRRSGLYYSTKGTAKVRGWGFPSSLTPVFPAAIHRTQPWFHGRISREDTQQLIGRQGLVDGYGDPGGGVEGGVKEEGRLYFTMDDGQTRFADLIQLVEFHQINRGILPCKLRHYCTCVAL